MTLDEIIEKFEATYDVTTEQLSMFSRNKPFPDLIAIFSYNARTYTGLPYTKIAERLNTHRHNIRMAKNRYDLYIVVDKYFREFASKFKL